MKLSHLSLAIFSAIALAACGGSSSSGDHTTPEQTTPDQNQGDQNTDQNTNTETETETETKEDAAIVDPTKDKVVDAITLSETSTTASQQYIRSAGSIHDRTVNPSNATPASATALSGITLDVQNPYLTNIVIGRIEGTNNKGEEVKVAQFAGSRNSDLPSLGNASGVSLQDENLFNALVSGRTIDNRNATASQFGWLDDVGYVHAVGDTLVNNPLFRTLPVVQDLATAYGALSTAKINVTDKEKDYNDAIAANAGIPAARADLDAALTALNTAVSSYDTALANLKADPNFSKIRLGSKAGGFQFAVPDDTKLNNTDPTTVSGYKNITLGQGALTGRGLGKYGYNSYWYAIDGNNINIWGDAGWGDTANHATGEVTGSVAQNGTDAGLPTTGLVGIYTANDNVIVRGDEDNNVRTSRIFGHYYLDPGSLNGTTPLAESANSWAGSSIFVTSLDGKGRPDGYGFGAVPMVLNHVQYGRVTAVIDDFDLANQAKTNGWIKVRQDYENRDPDHLNDADDFYFYRGTNATTIDQMAKLPADTKIKYAGHALMYGIDNRFHGAGLELPNAFGNTNSYGLGNFVEATLDVGAKKFEGSVFNTWHSPEQKIGQNDTLVTFSGDVTGNTVIGTAKRAYIKDDQPADLRASFYGAKAEEVGGSFNSVVRQDPFGPMGWGGVFGAKRTATGGNAWLVSSEDK